MTDTSKKKVGIVSQDEVSMPTMTTTPEMQFANSLRQGDIPEEYKGLNQYVFHRDTGESIITFREIYENRQYLFEVWAKTEEKARELFMKRTKWYKRKGRNTPCPLPEDK